MLMTMLDLPVHTTLPIKVMSQSSSGCLRKTILYQYSIWDRQRSRVCVKRRRSRRFQPFR